MHSASILLLVLGLLATVATARPGRRPWFGNHHHESGEKEGSEERPWLAYRLPGYIRLPRLLFGNLGKPIPTFTVKKVQNGKYLLVSPALLFKLKEVNNDTEASTTVVPEISTTVAVDEETTTVAVDEETTTAVPSSFGKRLFSFNDDDDDNEDEEDDDDEELSFFDD